MSEIPHFIGSVEDVKRLLRMVFEEDDEISMVRVGECLVFSDQEKNPLHTPTSVVSRPPDDLQTPLLVSPEILRNFQVKNTFLHVATDPEPFPEDSLARTVSAPAKSLSETRNFLVPVFPAKRTELRKVTWDLGPFKLLLACEVSVSDSPGSYFHPSISDSKPPLVNYKNLPLALDHSLSRCTAWLENSVLSIDQLAFARTDGSLQFIDTQDLVSGQGDLLARLEQLLLHLQTHCSVQGRMYTLSRRHGHEFQLCLNDETSSLAKINPSLILPIAQLALNICTRNLLKEPLDKVALLTRTLQLKPPDSSLAAQLALELVEVAPPSFEVLQLLRTVPSAGDELDVRLAAAQAQLLLEISGASDDQVFEAWRVLEAGVSAGRRAVECRPLEVRILRKIAEIWKKRAATGVEIKEGQKPAVIELREVLEKIVEISDEKSEISDVLLDLAEVAFSLGFGNKKDRSEMAKGRKYLVDVIGNFQGEPRNKALVALAKNFTAEATMMIGNLKRTLSLISLALLEISDNAREALAGEHFIAAKNLMIGNFSDEKKQTKSLDFGDYAEEWETIKTAIGNLSLEISDLSPVDHLEACLRLAESDRLTGLAHLEIAKLLGQDRKNDRKYLLALRHAQKALDLLPVAVSGSPEISAEASRVLASLHTRKDVRKALEILCEAEISDKLDVRSSMLDICRIMLKEIPDGRAKESLKNFYAAALRGTPAEELKKTL